MIQPAALSPAMVRTLRSAALGQLIAQPNHPSIRVLEKCGYVQRLEEVERRAGRNVVFSWGITEDGRERCYRSLSVDSASRKRAAAVRPIARGSVVPSSVI